MPTSWIYPVELRREHGEVHAYATALPEAIASGATKGEALAEMREALVAAVRGRIKDGMALAPPPHPRPEQKFRVELPAVASNESAKSGDAQAQAVRDGLQAKEFAAIVLSSCGFRDIRVDVKPRGLGIVLTFVATDQTGNDWAFDVSGAFTSNRAGLRRADTLWKSLGKAAVLHESSAALPLVLLTTDAPARGTAGQKALDVMRGPGHPIVDVIELLNGADQARLRGYAEHGLPPQMGE